MNYICYDKEGNILSCYSKKNKEENIKTPYILVDDKTYNEIIANQNIKKINTQTLEIFTITIPKGKHYKRNGKVFEFDLELALKFIRIERNKFLVESDWTQFNDSPISQQKKNEWKIYRQALRDFPATCDPENPVWPVKPE